MGLAVLHPDEVQEHLLALVEVDGLVETGVVRTDGLRLGRAAGQSGTQQEQDSFHGRPPPGLLPSARCRQSLPVVPRHE